MRSNRRVLALVFGTLVASTSLFGCKKLISGAVDDAVKDAGGSLALALAEAGAPEGGAGGKEASLDTIKFKKKDWNVNSSFTNNSNVDVTLEMTKPKASSFTSKDAKTAKVDILAADGKTILKTKVTFSAYSKVETNDGKTKDSTPPVTGKSYVAEFKDKKIVILDESRKKVSAKEEKAVKSEVNDILGKPDPLITALPGGPMKVGDTADSLSEALRELLAEGENDKVELTEPHVTLSKIEMQGSDKVGVFDMKAKINFKQGFSMVMDLTGTMTVRESDGKVTNMTLKGPLTMTGGGITAAGNVSATQTRTY